MGVEEHRQAAEGIRQISFAVITVSDSRDDVGDEAGKHIRDRMEKDGHRLVRYRLLKNDLGAIQQEVMDLVEGKVGCIVTTGGTGLGRRDLTIEAVTPLLDKSPGGFGELFRHLSFQEVGAAAFMSRATAGVSLQAPTFCLPGP